MKSGNCLIFLLTVLSFIGTAQDIPLGTWRTHISYNNVGLLSEGNNKVYAAVEGGIFYFDGDDQSINRITRLDGLQGGAITAIAYDALRDVLIVGYGTGNADIIRNDGIINLDLTGNSQVIGSKTVNDIVVSGAFAYLATDYGILRLATEAAEIQGTYREIGPGGEQISIHSIAIHQDSLFAAWPSGIIATALSGDVNPGDWRFWSDKSAPGPVGYLATAAGKLYAASDGMGIFSYTNSTWEDSGIPAVPEFRALNGAGEFLIVVYPEKAASYDAALPDMPVTADAVLITSANDALRDTQGNWWIGDGANGLISDAGGSFMRYSPSGPASSNVFRMKYVVDSLYVLTGGFSAGGQSLNRMTGVHVFAAGEWKNQLGVNDALPFNDLTSVAAMAGGIYYSSAGDGLLKLSGGTAAIIDETTPGSPLTNTDVSARGPVLTDMESGRDGIWMINFNEAVPLHRLSENGTWTSYPVPVSLARYAVEIELAGDLVWLRIAPARGGGLVVFSPETGQARYLNQQQDNGSLPSLAVHAMALDRDGFLWLGTAAGVTVITNPFNMQGNINAIEPIFEGRPLLIDETVKVISIDGGNRKWMGTENGAWLFDPSADELLLRFTEANSPLLSDDILAIGIDGRSGEVFFGTPPGIVSYRADATDPDSGEQTVKIFPNPVRQDFQGTVGISGLAGDAEVRITDSSGRLVYRTQANGGTASWDLNGMQLQSGIYMVFSATPDGREAHVGKIAIIR